MVEVQVRTVLVQVEYLYIVQPTFGLTSQKTAENERQTDHGRKGNMFVINKNISCQSHYSNLLLLIVGLKEATLLRQIIIKIRFKYENRY